MNKIWVLLLVSCSFSAFGQEVDSFQIELDRLLELTSSKDQFVAVMNQIIEAQQEMVPELENDEFWSVLTTEVLESGYEDILKELVPLYRKYYSVEELRVVNAFYTSPEGKGFLEKSPKVRAELIDISMEWGKKLGDDIARRLEEAQSK